MFYLHVKLGRLTCSGIDALPSFPGASAIPSSPGFVGEGVFRQSGVVHSVEVVDPVLFVFESHVLYSRDLQFLSYVFVSYFVQSCVSCNTFSYVIKIVLPFPFQSLITGVTVSRMRKQWEPGGFFNFYQVSHPYKTKRKL